MLVVEKLDFIMIKNKFQEIEIKKLDIDGQDCKLKI